MRCSIISIHGLWLSPFTLGQWGVLPYSLYIYTVVLELCLWTCPLYETSLRWTTAWSMLDFFCNKLTPLYNQVRVNEDSFIIFASLLPDKPPHGFFVCLFFAPGMCFSVCVLCPSCVLGKLYTCIRQREQQSRSAFTLTRLAGWVWVHSAPIHANYVSCLLCSSL